MELTLHLSRIDNINKSRTLNIVHRQLHQQYLSITYLNEVTFMFTNGYDSAKLQNDQLRLENMRVQQAMDLLNLISDPIQKAELYKKIFDTCCNTPQSGCCCGNCNGNGGGGGHGGEITR